MTNDLTRREFVASGTGMIAAGVTSSSYAGSEGAETALSLENRYVKYVIGRDGRNLHFIDKRTGDDHCVHDAANVCAAIKKGGKQHLPSEISFSNDRLTLQFDTAQCQAVVEILANADHFLIRVVSLTGQAVDEFTFADLRLSLAGDSGKSISACALALNLNTRVNELPQASTRLRAMCYSQFGFAGAQVAWLTCPEEILRRTMQRVVSAAEELPHSSIGGPWALGQPINQGSYLFNFRDLSEETVDDWIDLATSLGMNQIDFHGGTSFRFGDCRPNPKIYPRGFHSLKTVIDRLHAAGISAGLHTYAFFIHKSCPWVTPIPDARLAKDAEFTLAEPIAADANTVPVVEATDAMSTITGFFVRNSVTLQIDKELITYGGISKQPPFAFNECKRGACGTQVSSHAAGAKVHHLKECFGLFVPDPKTSLLAEVASKAAAAYNFCGFDMIYLDALDGEDILGGRENGWHYGSKFVFELCKRLDRSAVMEMSTFHHHLWYVRSRMGAWDHPTRSHKRFVDIHCQANEANSRMFLPGQLGWWAFKTWTDAQGEPTFCDDIEYLMAKCLGNDTGFALMGINPSNVGNAPALPRLAGIIERYEELRHSGKVSEATKKRLRVAGDEFTLIGNVHEEWRFQPVDYAKHKVETEDQVDFSWKVHNRYAPQALRLRIEALMAAEPYDSPEGQVLIDVGSDLKQRFPIRASQPGITQQLLRAEDVPGTGDQSGRYVAENGRPTAEGSWAKIETTFSPPRNLKERQALGMWVKGDGQNEVLNVQLRSPSHISHAIGDHYIVVDFDGWRYFELIEPEGERFAKYKWPYGGTYSIYRERVNYSQLETLGLWFNHLPPGKTVACCLGPIKALPLKNTTLDQPTVDIGGQAITFDVKIDTGCYLEFNSIDDCRLYGRRGELIRQVKCQGDVPLLVAGDNGVTFRAQNHDGVRVRANVTVISQGAPLGDG